MSAPLASVIMATMRGRKPLLRQAVKYFLRQTYPAKELVIIDDDPEECEPLSTDPRVRHIKVKGPLSTGRKLNIAAEEARGDILHKFDDDDWYRHDLLERSVRRLTVSDGTSIVTLSSFLILLLDRWALRVAKGQKAGTSMSFKRDLWKRIPFRNMYRSEDWSFLHDHGFKNVSLDDPELCVVMRHGMGHAWTMINGVGVEEYFQGGHTHSRGLDTFMPGEDIVFYKEMHNQVCSRTGIPFNERKHQIWFCQSCAVVGAALCGVIERDDMIEQKVREHHRKLSPSCEEIGVQIVITKNFTSDVFLGDLSKADGVPIQEKRARPEKIEIMRAPQAPPEPKKEMLPQVWFCEECATLAATFIKKWEQSRVSKKIANHHKKIAPACTGRALRNICPEVLKEDVVFARFK